MKVSAWCAADMGASVRAVSGARLASCTRLPAMLALPLQAFNDRDVRYAAGAHGLQAIALAVLP